MSFTVLEAQFWAACLGFALAQFSCAFMLALRLRRRPAGSAPRPPVSVVVPCRGWGEGIAASLRSMLSHDYPGEAEFFFVFAGESDPGVTAAHALAAACGGGAEVIVSRAAPENCSEQLCNMLAGLARVSPGERLLVFAPSDAQVPRGWLTALADSLPAGGVATAPPVTVPDRACAGGYLHMLLAANTLCYAAARAEVNGAGPYALLRSDFDRLGVAEAWRRSFNDDAPLYGLLRRAGARARLAPGAIPANRECGGAGDFMRHYSGWLMLARHYAPSVWLLSWLYALGKAGLLVLAAFRLGSPWHFAAALAVDALHAGAVLHILGRSLPDRFAGLAPALRPAPLWGALGGPLFAPVMLLCLALSARLRGLSWGGRWYEVRGPREVRALPQACAGLGLSALPPERETLAWLGELSGDSAAGVPRRLLAERLWPGSSVAADFRARGLKANEWSPESGSFYSGSVSQLYEQVVWRGNPLKMLMTAWTLRRLRRAGRPLGALCFGDGIGGDSAALACAGHQVTYFEPSGPASAFAGRHFALRGLEVRMEKDFSALRPGSFDAVLCLDVLEHAPDPEGLLKALAALLKPGGELLLSAPFCSVSGSLPLHLRSSRRLAGRASFFRRCGLEPAASAPLWSPAALRLAGGPPLSAAARAWFAVNGLALRLLALPGVFPALDFLYHCLFLPLNAAGALFAPGRIFRKIEG